MPPFEYIPFKAATVENESLEAHGKKVYELLQNEESILGEGRTARAHHGLVNDKVCYKIIPDVRSEFYNQGNCFTDVAGEARFLEDLQGIDDDVRVPKVYGTISVYDPKRADVLVMERLNAVSVKDVVEMRASLPESFDMNSFFKKLSVFLKKMHDRGIYHRDLHEGNIMIDVTTGNPYVIDFGSSKKQYFSEENPYVEVDDIRRNKRYFTDDMEWLKKVKRTLESSLALTQVIK